MKKILLTILISSSFNSFAQMKTMLSEQQWVDSVFNSLSDEQRIAQLMVVRLSERTPTGVVWHDQEVAENIRNFNIGSICLFQGGPVKQADVINSLQSIAQTPLMVCADGEWGLGMRFDSVGNFPFQLTMGAIQ